MATTFTRLADKRAGAASQIAIQELGFFSLTAVRTGAGDLKLINWETGDQSEVKRLAEASAGEISEIAVTRNLNRTITALRDGSQDLLLISWDDGIGEGPINRLADTHGAAGEASLIDIQPITSGSVANLVTAVRTGAGKLKLITWQLDSASGAMTRLGDSGGQAGRVSVIAASVQHNVVVTAVRTASGTLKLIAWLVSEDGASIERKAEAEAGAVSEIAMAGMVTAVRTASGKLKLISWGLLVDGPVIHIQRLHDHTAGKATRIALSRSNATRFVAAVRAADGDLKLIAYDVDPVTGLISRTGDSGDLAGAISEVALATPSSNNITTAVRDGGDRLKIITWRMTDA